MKAFILVAAIALIMLVWLRDSRRAWRLQRGPIFELAVFCMIVLGIFSLIYLAGRLF